MDNIVVFVDYKYQMVTEEMEGYDCVRFILAVSFMTQLYLK